MRRRPKVRPRDLGAALEVSERTIHRGIRDLVANGVPIEGAAGVGHVLRAGYDLPPLMFKEVEIEAPVLGARRPGGTVPPGRSPCSPHAEPLRRPAGAADCRRGWPTQGGLPRACPVISWPGSKAPGDRSSH